MKVMMFFMALIATVMIGAGVLMMTTPELNDFTWDLSRYQYEERFVEIEETVTTLDILLEEKDINIYPTDNEHLALGYTDAPEDPLGIEVTNGVLTIRETHSDFMTFVRTMFFEEEARVLNIYVPADLLEDVAITVTSGYVNINSITISGTLDISAIESPVELFGITTTTLLMDGLNAYATLGDVEVSESYFQTGQWFDLWLKNSSFDEVDIAVESSDIEMDTITATHFDADLAVEGDLFGELIEVTSSFSAFANQGVVIVSFDQPYVSIDHVAITAVGWIHFADFATYGTYSDDLPGSLDVTISGYEVSVDFN